MRLQKISTKNLTISKRIQKMEAIIMNISLTPKMDQWLAEKVASGMYSSSSEVILEGLRLLKRQEEQRQAVTEDLRQEILVGVMQLDSGKAISFDSSVIADIKVRGRDKLRI
jgi:antitoxin ParD1/3/4